jgi:hypothetical protein
MTMPITPQLPDEPPKDYESPDDMKGFDGLLQQLTRVVVNTCCYEHRAYCKIHAHTSRQI